MCLVFALCWPLAANALALAFVRTRALLLIAAAHIAACADARPEDRFFAALKAHCGRAYEGRVVSTDEADRDFAAARLVMEVRTCDEAEIRVPFHVGEDRSRTWIVTRTADGLRLKHDHRHEDGAPDALTLYGGDTKGGGLATRQEFPADPYSKDLFMREGRPASAENVWAMEIGRDVFAYELRRPNRHFRVEFDLSAPVASPGPPWGGE
jgi:hypothetical protein